MRQPWIPAIYSASWATLLRDWRDQTSCPNVLLGKNATFEDDTDALHRRLDGNVGRVCLEVIGGFRLEGNVAGPKPRFPRHGVLTLRMSGCLSSSRRPEGGMVRNRAG